MLSRRGVPGVAGVVALVHVVAGLAEHVAPNVLERVAGLGALLDAAAGGEHRPPAVGVGRVRRRLVEAVALQLAAALHHGGAHFRGVHEPEERLPEGLRPPPHQQARRVEDAVAVVAGAARVSGLGLPLEQQRLPVAQAVLRVSAGALLGAQWIEHHRRDAGRVRPVYDLRKQKQTKKGRSDAIYE